MSVVKDIKKYFKKMADDIYSEQTPKNQRRIDRAGSRLHEIKGRFDASIQENAPKGRDYLKRRLVGGATSLAEVLDGDISKRVGVPHKKPRVRKSRGRVPRKKPRPRKRRVVK